MEINTEAKVLINKDGSYKVESISISKYEYERVLKMQQQAHIEQDSSLLQQAPKDEVEKLQQELFVLEQQLMKARIDRDVNRYDNCCATTNYPNGFNPQSNWCNNSDK